MKKLNGLLINPFTQRIEQVQFNQNDLESKYTLLNCRLIDAIPMPNGDAIYFNDEGLFEEADTPYSNQEGLAAFFIEGITAAPIAGLGLVVGTVIDTGDDYHCKSTTFDFVDKLSFGIMKKEYWREKGYL